MLWFQKSIKSEKKLRFKKVLKVRKIKSEIKVSFWPPQ